MVCYLTQIPSFNEERHTALPDLQNVSISNYTGKWTELMRCNILLNTVLEKRFEYVQYN